MTTCLRKSCSFGLLCVSHRRRKVLNIGSGGGGGGVPNNYISHIEN